jgi:hypothetical protein
MTWADAIKADLECSERARNNNELVLATLPERPQRGTFEWWARLARQNTGRSLCDSGCAYGYNYEQPVSRTPLWVNTYWPSTMATGF